MKKEKKIFVYAVFENLITLKYESAVFSGQVETVNGTFNVWGNLPTKTSYFFNLSSVRQAKKLIRQAFCVEGAPEYACIVVNGKIKGIWWTHTKKHIETISISQFKRELWINGGVVADEIFKDLWRD